MKFRKILFIISLLILYLSVLSCAGTFRNYGKIVPSDEVTRDLDKGMVHPELRYFISGPDLYPNAFIGLHRNFRLNPEALWKEVTMTPEKLREIVDFMKAKAWEHNMLPYGFDLVNTDGKKIGFWYSIMRALTFVHFENDGTVTILAPKLDIYEERDIRDDKDREQ